MASKCKIVYLQVPIIFAIHQRPFKIYSSTTCWYCTCVACVCAMCVCVCVCVVRDLYLCFVVCVLCLLHTCIQTHTETHRNTEHTQTHTRKCNLLNVAVVMK